MATFCPNRNRFWKTHNSKYKVYMCIYIYLKDVMHTKKGKKESLHVKSLYGNKQISYRKMFIYKEKQRAELGFLCALLGRVNK